MIKSIIFILQLFWLNTLEPVVQLAYLTIHHDASENKSASVELIGAASPEALGKLLLTALKTNNHKLWNSCIHPESGVSDALKESFEQIRDRFEESGLTNWQLVKYSRVTFRLNSLTGPPDQGNFAGEKVRRIFKVEFTYKGDQYVGTFGDMQIRTYHNKNYFMYTKDSQAFMNRW